MVETPGGWITVPVVLFFATDNLHTTAMITHNTISPTMPPTTAPVIVSTGLSMWNEK